MEEIMPDAKAPAIKSRKLYTVLAIFLGLLGVHNIYAGRYKTAIVQALITLSLFWTGIAVIAVYFWVIFDIFMVRRDGYRNLMVEDSPLFRFFFGALMVFPGICFMLMATWFGLVIWSDMYPETGENVATVSWLPSSAKNVSFYKSYSWRAFEFDINENDFRQWAAQWNLKEIDKAESIQRYNYWNFLKEKHSSQTEDDMNAYFETKKRCIAAVNKGLYDSKTYGNGGGYHVVFDRERQRAYFQSCPR